MELWIQPWETKVSRVLVSDYWMLFKLWCHLGRELYTSFHKKQSTCPPCLFVVVFSWVSDLLLVFLLCFFKIYQTNSTDVTLRGVVVTFTRYTVSSKQNATHPVETWETCLERAKIHTQKNKIQKKTPQNMETQKSTEIYRKQTQAVVLNIWLHLQSQQYQQ